MTALPLKQDMLQKFLLGLVISFSWTLWPQSALSIRPYSSRRPLQRPFSQTMIVSVDRTPWRTNTTSVSTSQEDEVSASKFTTDASSAPQDLNALLKYGFTDRQAHALMRKLKSKLLPPPNCNGAVTLSAPPQALQLLQDLEIAGLTCEQLIYLCTTYPTALLKVPPGARGWCWHKKHFCTCGAVRNDEAAHTSKLSRDLDLNVGTSINSSRNKPASLRDTPAFLGIDCEFSPWRVALVGPKRQVLLDALVVTPPGTDQSQALSKPRLDRILPADLATALQVTPAEVREFVASMIARQGEGVNSSSAFCSEGQEVNNRSGIAVQASVVVGHTVDVDLERFYGSVVAGHEAIYSAGASVVDVCPPLFLEPINSSTVSLNGGARQNLSQKKTKKAKRQQLLHSSETTVGRSVDTADDAAFDAEPAPQPSRALKALLAAAGLPAVQAPGLRHCPVEDAFGALDLYCFTKK